jgi:hypothetical protein
MENKNLSLKTLKIDGKNLMDDLKMTPGPSMGYILNILLSEIINDLKLNTKKYLITRAKELVKKTESQLKKESDDSKKVFEKMRVEEENKIKSKHGIR